MIQIEIWSDVVCPFCYIGKRRLERALAGFAHAGQVEITWRSFLLDAQLVTEPGKSINQHLSERKGWSMEQTREINAYVTEMAAGEGLDY
ncbi:MAG TPA: DsbA family protein, partial [Chitinophagales bacterium]|nr:DsbA family protein [Chitinophagales bacterium]